MKQLDKRAFWLFFLNVLIRSLFLVIILSAWSFIPLIESVGEVDASSGSTGLIILLIIIAWIVLAVILAKLTYHFYRYELTENGFRKEHGIIYKKYVTIPYERIQNVDIHRGILARILGLSDLNIQTAGMSVGFGSYGGRSEGRLPGLSQQDAEQLRDELIIRAKHGRSGGI